MGWEILDLMNWFRILKCVGLVSLVCLLEYEVFYIVVSRVLVNVEELKIVVLVELGIILLWCCVICVDWVCLIFWVSSWDW